MNILENLSELNNTDWNNVFSHMEKVARENIANRDNNLLYRYLGEIDCPSEMFEMFATVDDVANCNGKTNWFICSDGTFFTCGDEEVNILFEEGKVVDYEFPFEVELYNRYELLSRDERVNFRMQLQNITELEAKEIVYRELGIPLYKYSYTFAFEYTLHDSFDNSEETKQGRCEIPANSESEAYDELYRNQLLYLHKGAVVQTGTRYTKEDNDKAREMGISIFKYKGGTPFTITVVDCKVELTKVVKN